MKKLNVLRCVDQNFWAYAIIAKEHSLYTKHNMTYLKHDEVNLNGQDVIYIHSPDISGYHAEILPLEAKKKGIKVIGAYAGNPLYWSPAEKRTYSDADIIVTISPQTYSFAKFHYSDIPVIYMPECVDTDYFTPKQFSKDTFIVGWTGGKHKKIKRFALTEQLDYSIQLQDDWKERRKINNRELDLSKMKDFYQSIDVLIVTSESECQPRVVMEAMAGGLPIIATNVGSMKMLLGKEWIVDVYPDAKVVQQMNEKLSILEKNPKLRKEVGERNREHIQKYFSWKSTQLLWDNLFENIYKNNIKQIIKDSDNFLKPFKEDFESEFLDFKPNEPEPEIKPQPITSSPIPEPITETIIEQKPVIKVTRDEIIKSFIIQLNNCVDFPYWIANKSCLEIINNNKIQDNTNYLLIGVNNLNNHDHLKDILTKYNLNLINIDILVCIEPEIKTFKQMPMNGILVNVPFPVINYLENLFGKGCIK